MSSLLELVAFINVVVAQLPADESHGSCVSQVVAGPARGSVQGTNRAVLILLIARNVLIETRKKPIHMEPNQSHAVHIQIGRTLVEQQPCSRSNGC